MIDLSILESIKSLSDNKECDTVEMRKDKKYEIDDIILLSIKISEAMDKKMVLVNIEAEKYVFQEYPFANYNLYVYTEFILLLFTCRPTICYTNGFNGLEKNTIYVQIRSTLILEIISSKEAEFLVEKRFGGKFKLFQTKNDSIFFKMMESSEYYGPLLKIFDGIIKDLNCFSFEVALQKRDNILDLRDISDFLNKVYRMKFKCERTDNTIKISLEKEK